MQLQPKNITVYVVLVNNCKINSYFVLVLQLHYLFLPDVAIALFISIRCYNYITFGRVENLIKVDFVNCRLCIVYTAYSARFSDMLVEATYIVDTPKVT